MDSVKNSRSRVFEYDFIKVIYALLILGVHAIWYSGYYSHPVNGIEEFVTMMFRNLACNGPLLFLITGCLMRNRKINKMYYFGLFRIYIGFLLSAIVVLWARDWLLGYGKGNIWEILDFSASPYGWFISMYMGLYILIPFLNTLYDKLTEKQRLYLLITLCVLTVIPSTVNIYNYAEDSLRVVFPNWWENLFPITFYIIGIWVSDKDFKLKKRTWALILLGSIFLQTIIICSMNKFGPFNLSLGDRSGDKCNIFSVINAVCIFELCRNIKTNSKIVGKTFELCSKVMLETILMSVLIDTVLYLEPVSKLGTTPIFKTLINGENFAWLLLSVPLSYILSTLISLPIGFLSNQIIKPLKKLYVKIVSPNTKSRKDTKEI